VDWFVHAHNVYGKFGHAEEHVLPTTFGLNQKGGMNSIELDKYIKQAILPLYPDVADVPGKRVMLKVDSGPGRLNVNMLATLRLQGVYLAPGFPMRLMLHKRRTRATACARAFAGPIFNVWSRLTRIEERLSLQVICRCWHSVDMTT